MAKSVIANELDALQGRISPMLRDWGFRKHGRTFNRTNAGGLINVFHFQMGRFDPPGTTCIPRFRENLYGRFTINIGVCVPEVLRYYMGREIKSVVHETECCIRTRLGEKEGSDLWWAITTEQSLIEDITHRLEHEALGLFERYGTRDKILGELQDKTKRTNEIAVPRIVCALILFEKGDRSAASRLLRAQMLSSSDNNGHQEFVLRLARKLGLEILA